MEEDPTMQRAWGYHWRRVVAWSALSALVAMTGLTLAALGAGRGLGRDALLDSGAAGRLVTVTVPAGLHGGDDVRFQAGEGTYAARIPLGMQPGQSFKVDLGSMAALAQRPRRIQVRVSVPNGVGPGDSFEFTHFGKTFEAKVPEDFHPGDQVEVGLPADMSSVPAGFDSAAGVNTLAEVAPVASVQA